MKLQKIILAISALIIAVVFIAEYLNINSVCISSACADAYNSVLLGWLFMSVMTTATILLLFRFQREVFITWWKFARIAIPVILVISRIINLGFHHTSGGFINTSDALDIPAHILMYSIFVIGSIIQIVRGYRISRTGE